VSTRPVGATFRGGRGAPRSAGLAGLACALLAAVGLAAVPVPASADTSFSPGSATATAQVIEVGPSTGGLNYAVSLDTSQAAYQNATSEALSQTLDLGFVGTSLEKTPCNGGSPTLNPKDVPPPIQVESDTGDQSQSTSLAAPLNGAGAGAGSESASATTEPGGNATTTLASEDLAGLVQVEGATATAQAALVNGGTRSSTATSAVSSISLGNGLVVLSGLRWTANQTSGASNTSTATFQLGSLTIKGVSVPVANDNAATVLAVVNTALAPTGLSVSWPATSTLTDGTITISPLTVGINDSELGQEVVGANLGQTQTVRNSVQQALLNLSCRTATELLISDIGVGILAGGGGLNVVLGGAEAVTSAYTTVSPFGPVTFTGAGGSALSSGGDPTTTLQPAGTLGNSGSGGSLSTTTFTTSPDPAQPSDPATATQEALPPQGPVSTTFLCRSLGTAGGGCDTSNFAVPVGLGALALLGGLVAAEYRRGRRFRPRESDEPARGV
jgi:hypothetical protein